MLRAMGGLQQSSLAPSRRFRASESHLQQRPDRRIPIQQMTASEPGGSCVRLDAPLGKPRIKIILKAANERLAARERQALVQRSMRFKVLTCALVHVAQNV